MWLESSLATAKSLHGTVLLAISINSRLSPTPSLTHLLTSPPTTHPHPHHHLLRSRSPLPTKALSRVMNRGGKLAPEVQRVLFVKNLRLVCSFRELVVLWLVTPADQVQKLQRLLRGTFRPFRKIWSYPVRISRSPSLRPQADRRVTVKSAKASPTTPRAPRSWFMKM